MKYFDRNRKDKRIPLRMFYFALLHYVGLGVSEGLSKGVSEGVSSTGGEGEGSITLGVKMEN